MRAGSRTEVYNTNNRILDGRGLRRHQLDVAFIRKGQRLI